MMVCAILSLILAFAGILRTTRASKCNQAGKHCVTIIIYQSAKPCRYGCFIFYVTVGNQSSLCKKCPEYDLANGTASYRDLLDNARGEGSLAIFACNAGYQLSGAPNATCKEGNWIGAIATCEEIDECHGVDCGGLSKCVDGVGQYTCECADGWSGGGVNTICEKGICQCTGNQGYWQARNTKVNGEYKIGYNFGPTYGEYCAAHDMEQYDPSDPETEKFREMWYASGAGNTRKNMSSN